MRCANIYSYRDLLFPFIAYSMRIFALYHPQASMDRVRCAFDTEPCAYEQLARGLNWPLTYLNTATREWMVRLLRARPTSSLQSSTCGNRLDTAMWLIITCQYKYKFHSDSIASTLHSHTFLSYQGMAIAVEFRLSCDTISLHKFS